MPASEVLAQLAPEDAELLARRLASSAECMFDQSFHSPDAEAQYTPDRWGLPRIQTTAADGAGGSDDSGVDLLAASTTTMTVAPEDERRMFLQLNYCRYRVMRVIRECRGEVLTLEAANELIRWERAASDTRDELVRLNVPLVLAMARRTRITGVDFSDLISEGNLALVRSVDKFDSNRGYKFSTYACRAILKSFSRVAVRTSRYRGYFPTEFDPTLERSNHVDQQRENIERDCVNELRSILGQNLAKLNDVEATVIRARFALDDAPPPASADTTDAAGPTDEFEAEPRGKTLEEVGEMIGVTKERVRQIQNKALGKLRQILEQGILATR